MTRCLEPCKGDHYATNATINLTKIFSSEYFLVQRWLVLVFVSLSCFPFSHALSLCPVCPTPRFTCHATVDTLAARVLFSPTSPTFPLVYTNTLAPPSATQALTTFIN